MTTFLDIFFIAALVLTSMVGLTFIIERGLALRWSRVVPPAVVTAVETCNSAAGLPALRETCQQHPSALSRLILAGADHLHWPRAETVDVLQTRARREIASLDRGLVVLEIVVGIAPLLGLVGTVFGLITLFGGLSSGGLGDYAVLAKGVGLALNATLMGLLIAIPALVGWSYYTKKVETLAVEMETLCDEFLRRNYRHEEKKK